MTAVETSQKAFLYSIDGSLWLQGERELPDEIVSRSEQLSTMKDALCDADPTTASYIHNVTVDDFDCWLLAVAADDKALSHLSAHQLAQTLTAADFLKDTALIKDVSAAQRPRILAAKAHDPPPASGPESQAAPGTVHFSSDGALRWFEQLAAELPETVLWTLLREAVGCPKHIGDTADVDEWLLALPADIMAFAARACAPCIDIRGAFHARITSAEHTQRVAALIGALHDHLQAIFVMLPPQQGSPAAVDGDVDSLLAAVCAVPALRTLHIGLQESNINAATLACIAQHLPAAAGLESLTIEVITEEGINETRQPVVDTTLGKEFPVEEEGDAGSENFTALQRELAQALGSLPRLEALKLAGLRGFEETVGVVLRVCLPTMTVLRRLHAIDCMFQRDVDALVLLHLTQERHPGLVLCHVGPTLANTASISEAGRAAMDDDSDLESDIVTVNESTRVRLTYQRVPHGTSGSATGKDGADAIASGDRSGVDDRPAGGWEVTRREIALSAVTAGDGASVEAGCAASHTVRAFHLDGGGWGVHGLHFLNIKHGLRFPSAACAAAVLSPQTRLTELFLGGELQPHDDVEGHALAAVLARLPALRALSLRAIGMPPSAVSQSALSWDSFPEGIPEKFECWAPATVQLMRAREGHAVPLERLSLDVLHPMEGATMMFAPEEAAAEYTADVRTLVSALGRLTSLTSLNFSVSRMAVVPEPLIDALAQQLSSLRELRWLRLSVAWSASVPADAFMHSLRQLSLLTELQLLIETRRGWPIGPQTFAKVALGLERAMAGEGGAGDRQGERGSSASGNRVLSAPGMLSLRILRLARVAKGFGSAVRQVERAGRHWKAAKGSSRLLDGVCVTAQHAEWLEAVGELQNVVKSAGDRLYIVLR